MYQSLGHFTHLNQTPGLYCPVLWAHTRGHVIQGCTVYVEAVALAGLQQGTTLRVLKCNTGHCATAYFPRYIEVFVEGWHWTEQISSLFLFIFVSSRGRLPKKCATLVRIRERRWARRGASGAPSSCWNHNHKHRLISLSILKATKGTETIKPKPT